MNPATLDSIRRLMAEYVSANPQADLAIGVVTPGETWISEDAPTLRYEIGSITKVVTAILVAEATLRGLVTLEVPASKYLGLPLRASVASLLTHTSGLPRLPLSMIFSGEAFRRQPYALWSRNRLRFALALSPFAKGGAPSRYSNLGFAALGLLLERVYGRAYEDLVQEWLYRHGLASTSLKEAPELELVGKTAAGRPIAFWRMAAFAPAGGIRSTIGDMVEFVKICLGDDPAVLLSQQPRPESPKMGLGWHILPNPEIGDIIWHNGGTAACRTFFGLSRKRGRGVVVMSNTPVSVDALGIGVLKLASQMSPLG